MQNPTETPTWIRTVQSIDESTFLALKVAVDEGWISEEQVKGFVNQLMIAATTQLNTYNNTGTALAGNAGR